jgi:YVTN family beta-propeller protein
VHSLQLLTTLAALFAAPLTSSCTRGPADVPPKAPRAYEIFVTNEMSGDLSIVDSKSAREVARIALGKRPRGLQASPDGELLYVALSGSPIAGPGVDESTLPPADKSADGIGVFDVRARKLVRIIRGDSISDPEQLSLSPDGATMFIASEDTGTAVVVDVATGAELAKLPVGGEPEGVATHPSGDVVYMTSEEENTIAVIDARTRTVVTQIAVGVRPRAIVFSPEGTRAYVSCELEPSIAVIDARQHRLLQSIDVGEDPTRPMGVAVTRDGRVLYVATGRGTRLLAIDTKTLAITGSVEVGQRPWGIALSPDDKRIYTANGPSNDVAIVDAKTLQVVARVAVGERPWGVVALATR